jgi:2-iminobutanoate/2-iminopropanoate deaminase
LVCSGQIGLQDGQMVEGGIMAQTARCVANLAALLETEGAALTDVVKTTVFLADIADYADFNTAYSSAFGDHRPARSAVGVGGLPLGALVEIEAWAYTG